LVIAISWIFWSKNDLLALQVADLKAFQLACFMILVNAYSALLIPPLLGVFGDSFG